MPIKKSSRNDTLLTVDFNLRKGNVSCAPKSRRDDTCILYATDNKVSSLRDIATERSRSSLPPTQNFYRLLIFHSLIIAGFVAITIGQASAQNCDPVRTIRIQDYGDAGNPARYLRDNAGTPEWSATADNNSVWYEIPVEESDGYFYYKNAATNRYLYRETTGKKSTDCDWTPEKALLSATNPATGFYQFRIMPSTWGNRYWLVNVADADFGNIPRKGAFVLSGINKNVPAACDMLPYPVVVTTAIPNDNNVWHSIAMITVAENVTNPDCTCDVSITTHPQSAQYNVGDEAAALMVTASGEGLSYRWFQSADNSNRTPADDIITGEGDSFTPDITTASRSYYYAKVSNENCERSSNVAVITVKSPGVPFYPDGYPKTAGMGNPLFWQFGSPKVDASGALIPGSNGNLYTADASGHVWNINGTPTLFVYASHDMEQAAGCDRMDRYHVFSTVDMVNWTDYGEILNADDVPWHNGTFRNNSKFMWAPDAAYKNGKYYFYFPHPSQNSDDGAGSWGNNWKIGIAVSDFPASDFVILPQTLGGLPSKGEIDPCIFVDDDEQAYFFYGGGGRCYGARMSDNMIELAEPLREMEGLNNFHEATWVHKYNGKYYLSYSDNGGGGAGNGDQLKYAMSDSPLGPWKYMGAYLYATGCGTNHGSVVEFKGQWYAFYHSDYVSFSGESGRSVHVDKLFHNTDGSIQLVNTFGTPFKGVTRTVKETANTTEIALVLEAEDFNDGGKTYGYMDRDDTERNVYRPTAGMTIEARAGGVYNLGSLESKEFTRYTIHVEKAGLYDVDCYVASQNNGGRFHLNINGVNKTGTVSVTGNGGWGDGGFAKLTVPNVPFNAGENLFELRIENGGFNIDRFEFRKAQPYAGTPFKENNVPGKIEAEDFDNGGQGVAYYDSTPTNQGGYNYRAGERVDIENSAGSVHISHTSSGEWIKYTLNVTVSGIYDVTIRVATGNGGSGSLSLTFDDVTEYQSLSAVSANWNTYTTVTQHDVELMKGVHVMTMTVGGNINIDWYEFELISEIKDPPTSAAELPQSGSDDITLYPNPTTGIVNLDIHADIKVYNMQGALLGKFFGSQVDLSAYPAGIYLLQINNKWRRVIKNI